MPGQNLSSFVGAVRHFNRFYTRRIGVLREGIHGSPFSLAQARVLYEIGHRDLPAAAELGRDLGLDAGYLSRILGDFEKDGFIRRARSEADGRRSHLALTPRGRAALGPLDESSRKEIGAMLGGVPPSSLARLAGAMAAIEEILGGRPVDPGMVVLRSHRPGDLGWIVHRHGLLYARERGWDERFEALVARIVSDFARRYEPRLEHCWIAERNGEPVGSIMLTRNSKTVGRLRLLLVEPTARGRGIGRLLVEECIRFARQAGYRSMVLWTGAGLEEARRIYEKAGFRLLRREGDAHFGATLEGETWELRL